ncbi:guanine nucleotide-binding protein-like 3 homolog [Anabrus simplex]|uniref:guanine nucleotide-binding protein-like 3 homolog n=1 Tax=Anabrus simplex TaxID=316456 RepID=UPI0035A386FA
MAKLCLKKQSKRIPARKRYKIEKKVREHNRRLRREKKKNPKKGEKKIIQVPNICPFKEDILKDVENYKRKKEEERQKQRESLAQQWAKEKEENKMKELKLEHVVQNAQTRQTVHDRLQVEPETKKIVKGDKMQAYYREFKKVLHMADIILEVLDARDPLGTRCKQVEQAVIDSPGNKRLVFVLNKADLVPRENLDRWLKYLRRFFPAVPFKATTQMQNRRLGHKKMAKHLPEKAMKNSTCVGAELLMSLLGNYCRNKDIKTCISVGIVGLPNVGKSSIINSLKRSRACSVGATPGVTRNMQQVQLDSKIKLIDSPGIVFASPEINSEAAIALKNAVRVEALADPITPANAILQRADKHQLMQLYTLAEYKSPEEFFPMLAKRMGRFKKRGIPDSKVAARTLIEDWNRGRIRYYTVPPEDNTDIHISSEIVQTVAAEFDIAAFEAMETDVLSTLEAENKQNALPTGLLIESTGPVDMMDTSGDKVDNGVLADNVSVSGIENSKKLRVKKDKEKSTKSEAKKTESLMSLEGNQKLNKHKKLEFKKLKKTEARRDREAASLAGVLEQFTLSTGQSSSPAEDYDFEVDFHEKE